MSNFCILNASVWCAAPLYYAAVIIMMANEQMPPILWLKCHDQLVCGHIDGKTVSSAINPHNNAVARTMVAKQA